MTERPNHSYLFIVFIALVFLRPLVSGSGLDFFGTRGELDILLRLGVLSIALILIASGSDKKLDRTASYGMGLWLAWALVASLMAGMAGRSIYVSLQRLDVYVSLVAFAVVAATLADCEDKRLKVIIALMAAGIVAALYGLWQYFFGFDRTAEYIARFGAGSFGDAKHFVDVLEQKRIFSTTFSPNMLAGLMATLIPLVLAYGFIAHKKGDKKAITFGLVTVLACIVTLYLTGSLGGWLATGAGVVLFAIAASQENRKQIVAVMILLAVIASMAGAIVFRRAEVFTKFDHPHNPIAGRLNYWKGGIDIFASHPAFGVGPAHFGPAYLAIKSERAGKSRYAHNAVVQYAAEHGAPGIAGFVLVVMAFIGGAIKLSKKDMLGVGILAGGCAFLAHSMIDYDTEIIEIASVFWVLLGMAINEKSEVKSNRYRIPRALLTGCILVVILFEIVSATGAFFMEKARGHIEKSEFAEAEMAIERSRLFRGMDPAQAGLEAEVFFKSGSRAIKVESALRRLVVIDSLDPYTWMELGGFYLQKGDWTQAERTLNKAVELFPSFTLAVTMAHFSRAHLLIERGDLERARGELKAVLKDFPDHKGAIEGLEHIKRLEKERGK